MATNYSPTIVTDGLKYSGDPLMPSTAENGSSRLYDNVGAKSSEVKFLLSATNSAGTTFRDSSLSNHTITPYGDVTRSSTESRFNDSSIKFDGTGDYLTLADSDDWSFGDGDFTIDFWVYPTDNSTNYQGLITQVPSETGTGMWIEYNAGTLRLFVRNGSGDLFTEINGSMVKDNWHHVAVVRKENTMYLYKDGYSQGSSSYSGTWPNFSASVYIGYRNSYGHFTGYMDQIRIVKGTALYDTTFVPPTRPSGLDLYDGMMRTANQLDFDGTDDKVSYGDVTWIDGATNITFACWVYLEGSPPGAGGVLLSKDNALECWVKQSSSDQFVMSINNNHVAFDSDAPEIRLWTHVAMTWNSTGDVRKLYLNGQLKSTKTTGTQSGNSINNTSEGLAIGSRDGNNYEINGQISDVRLFNKTLDAAQIKQICNNPKVIVPDNLSISDYVFYAPLSEGTGTVAYDASGRQRHGTLTGADWVTGRSGANQLIQGYNKPMLLDGSTDYVSIADSASLSVGSTFTISYWFYPESVTTEAYHVSKNTYSGNQKSYAVLQASSGKTQFRISGDGSSHIECTGSTTMSNKTWHHIVHVFDGSAGTKLKGWVDGTAQTFNQQPNVTGPYDSTSILCLGTRDAGLVAPLKGTINEVIIYNSALSDANATALFATGPNGGPLPPDPLSMSTSGNIVGYWRNDSNVTLTDLSGNSNTGTAVGSPSALLFKEGYNGNKNVNSGRDSQGFPLKNKNNGAIGFNGSDDYVNVADSSLWDATGGISVGGWCYANSLGSYNVIVNQWSTAANSSSSWTLETVGSDWRFYMYDSGAATLKYASSTGTATTGAWKHIVGVFNGATLKVYVNGVEGGTTATVTTANTSSFPLRLGRFYDTATGSWDGQIACTQIYNRALSRLEILQNYNAQKSRFT